MTPTQRQCAAVVLQDISGRILAVQHNYGQRFWGVPGGIVERGETPMQAAQREALEEVGLSVEVTRLIGVYLLQGGGWPDILAFVFSGEGNGEPRIVNPDEIAAVRWLPPDQFPSPVLPDVEAALEDFRAGRVGVVRNVQRKMQLSPLTI